MPFITKETKIILLIAFAGMLLACLIFGPEVLRYMGPFILLWQ